jgi:iron complex outermembrane receptor protein
LVLKASFVTSVVVASVQADETELDSITINANVFGKSANQVAQPVTVLTDEELERQRAGSLGETLGLQSGINSSSYGTAVGRPVIGGLGGVRVKILQGGIDTLDASAASPDHSVSVDTQSATQIEVLRGPATLRYGRGAFGGVVNMIDNRIPNGENRDASDPNTEIKVGYDSVEYKIPDLKEHSDHEGDHDNGHEYEHDDEYEENSDVLAGSDISKRNNFTLGTSYVFDSVFAAIAISRFDQPFAGSEHIKVQLGMNDYAHDEIEDGAVGTKFRRKGFEAALKYY